MGSRSKSMDILQYQRPGSVRFHAPLLIVEAHDRVVEGMESKRVKKAMEIKFLVF